MFSSLHDQLSWQNQHLSRFTRSVAESVASFQGTELRFKDMIDHISDFFRADAKQTPFFVTQTSNTEVFCKVDSKVRDFVAKRIRAYGAPPGAPSAQGTAETPPKDTSLAGLVKADAERYCSEEEVMDRLGTILDYWTENPPGGVFAELYDLQVIPLAAMDDDVPMVERIGKWLSENRNDYFALPITRVETYVETISVPKQPKSLLETFTSRYSTETETKTVTKEHDVCVGYRLTQQTGFTGVKLQANPKYQNIDGHECHVLFVFSKTEIRFFYLFSVFRQMNWKERERRPSEQWRMRTAELKLIPSIHDSLNKITSEFSDFIAEPIRNRFAPPKPDVVITPTAVVTATNSVVVAGKKEPTKRYPLRRAPRRGTRR